MMEELTNVMPIVSGEIRRRWGYSGWANPGIIPTTYLYDYQSDLTLQRQVILSSPSYVQAQNDDGSAYNPNLFNPTSTSAPREVTSRSYAYFSDGQRADYLKWDGSAEGGVTNWGIDINDVAGAIAGPMAPGSVDDQGVSGNNGAVGPINGEAVLDIPLPLDGDGNSTSVPWSDTTNIPIFDQFGVNPASCDFGSQGPNPTTGNPGVLNNSDLLQVSAYQFAIPPSAIISGVQVSILVNSSPVEPATIIDQTCQLIKGGIPEGNDYANGTAWSSGLAGTYRVYGGPNDTWGLALTPTDVNAMNFGVQFGAKTLSTENAVFNPAFGWFQKSVGIAYIGTVSITVFYSGGGAPPSWNGVTNVQLEDGVVAVSSATVSPSSILRMTNFGFSVDTSNTVLGIEVDVKCFRPSGTNPVVMSLTLLKGGNEYGSTKSATVSGNALGFISFGSPSDLWGGSWFPPDINVSGGDTDFGVDLTVQTLSGTSSVAIDYIRVTVFSGAGPLMLGSPGSGLITTVTTIGRQYYAVFENSTSGNYSDLTPVSAGTGMLTSQTQPLTNLPVSLDMQVDRINILATADGGDEELLYLIANIPSGLTTYTDNMPEATLLNQPILLSTDATGTEFGVSNNDPPPVGGIYPTKHRGRLYLLNGPAIHWSKSLTDVTTASGFIAGRWEEDWPPTNNLDISEESETGRGMLSDGINLYIGTEFKIRRVQGDAPFLESPDIVHNEVGILNQDVWKIVFLEGTPQGAMWVTPDSRIIASDFNTYTDVGTPIQTTLDSINFAVATDTARATFFSSGAYDLYILAIPTGTSTTNDTVCVYNLRSQKWFIWQLADNVTSLLFHILRDGSPQLLLGTVPGGVFRMDETVTQDRAGAAPIAFPTTIRTSWLDLGDPSMRKMLNEVELQTGDPGMMVTVEGASTVQQFMAPNTVVSNYTVRTSPRGEYKVYLASATTKDRYYRFTFVSVGPVVDVLYGLNIELLMTNRQ